MAGGGTHMNGCCKFGQREGAKLPGKPRENLNGHYRPPPQRRVSESLGARTDSDLAPVPPPHDRQQRADNNYQQQWSGENHQHAG